MKKRWYMRLGKIYSKHQRWFFTHCEKIIKKKVVFSQFGGKGYGCNPKAICEEFLRRDEGYELVWILNKQTKKSDAGIPEGVRIVRGRKAYFDLFTARVWINNIHFIGFIKNGLYKRKGTIYLNTFHGGITLKSEGTDKKNYSEEKQLSERGQLYRKDSEFVDYITSGCPAEDHVLEEFFYGHGEILRFGDARTDVLVNGSETIYQQVREHYNVPDGTKIITYAPTFRSDMSLKWYDLDYERVLDTLEEKYGCPWVMLIRLHPRLADKSAELMPDSDRFIDASDYRDMQDLAVASDMLISDYSSVITDFMLTRKPALMYVPDLKKYLNRRGMYYKMEDLPFPYALNTDDFIACIKNFDEDLYKKKVDEFLDRIEYLADGHAAERVVDFLIEKMK